MVNQTAYIYRVLVFSLAFIAFAPPAVAESTNTSRDANAFTQALMPGFVHPSRQFLVPGFAEYSRRPEPRFSLKPVDEEAVGRSFLSEPVIVDNLLRFHF